MPTPLFIVGYAVVYFITIWNIFRHCAFAKIKCKLCGEQFLLTHTSKVSCPKCGAIYEIEEWKDKKKMTIKLVIQKGEVLQNCVRCESKFIVPNNFVGMKKCPSCKLGYFIQNKEEYRFRPLTKWGVKRFKANHVGIKDDRILETNN